MVAENPTSGAPRIHGEFLMLGFDVSERTISRWMKRAPRQPEPAQRWLTFLHCLNLVECETSFFGAHRFELASRHFRIDGDLILCRDLRPPF
jgi:hypothetical protein